MLSSAPATRDLDRLRVLFLTRKHPPAVGGMEKLSAELVQALTKIVDARVIAWGGSQRWLFVFLPYCFLRAIVEILRWRPDVVHLGDPIMCLVGRPLSALFGVPAVVTVHGLDVTYPRAWYQRFIVPLIGRCERVICISAHTREKCEERDVADRAVIIPPGVWEGSLPAAGDAARQRLTETRLSSGHDGQVLLTVGRLVERKGVARFVRTVLPRLVDARPHVTYWVVGEGPHRGAIEQAIEECHLGDHVRLFGRVSSEMLGAIYEQADVFVMPNVPVEGDMEGFGLVAVEANLAGMPVVAAELEGITDAVKDGENGHLVAWNQPHAMVELILGLLDSPNKAELDQRARQYALATFSWGVIARKYQRALAEAAGKLQEAEHTSAAGPTPELDSATVTERDSA